ncbi:DUF3368 domain-containing protein [Leptolyngbya subtilissima]|uniref:DUF3368 domain-containing protein n=1 Tax=Leptolyngbya subtilissima TaxID=1346803 RepID=UPI003D65DF32
MKVAGALEILLLAKRQKLVIDVRPIMDNLINQASFRISQQLYVGVLDAANEERNIELTKN